MPPRHKKSRRSREGSDGLNILQKNETLETKSRENGRGYHLRRVPLRENNFIRDTSFSAGFLACILPQDPFPSLTDSGTIIPGTCLFEQAANTYSGATTTDFHRVPFSHIRPEVGPNRKASCKILKERQLYLFYISALLTARKKLNIIQHQNNPVL